MVKRVHWSDGDTRPVPFEFVDTDELQRLRELEKYHQQSDEPNNPATPTVSRGVWWGQVFAVVLFPVTLTVLCWPWG